MHCVGYEQLVTSAKEVMFLLWFVCLLVCLFFVCLFIKRITQNIMDGFSQTFLEELALGLGIIDYILGVIRMFCLFVCLQDNTKSYGWIVTKFWEVMALQLGTID